MKKVIVTGGLGFIGYHLCQRLILNGVEVIAIDEMPNEKKEYQEEMLMRLGRNALLTIIDKKLEKGMINKLVNDVDVIFHLAASTSTDSKWSKLNEVIENNVKLTKQLIEETPTSTRIIYSSTVEVYGDRSGEITERTPTNPISPYGITKLASENVIQQECSRNEIDYIILRLPTVYGPWQREDMTYQQIIKGNIEPEVDRSTLDVLYVEDVVDALILSATTNNVNEIYHLTSGIDGAWFEGIRLLKADDQLFERSKIKTIYSPEKVKSLLGFEAKTPLKNGIDLQRTHIKKWKERRQM